MRFYTHIAQGPGPRPPGGTPVITLCEKRRTLNETDVKRRWTLWCPECIRRQLQIVHNLVTRLEDANTRLDAVAAVINPELTGGVWVDHRDGRRRLDWVSEVQPLNYPANPAWDDPARHDTPIFFQDGKLRKVSLAGGPPIPIATVAGVSEASWSEADLIVFSEPPPRVFFSG